MSFWFVKNVVVYELSIKFRFSTTELWPKKRNLLGQRSFNLVEDWVVQEPIARLIAAVCMVGYNELSGISRLCRASDWLERNSLVSLFSILGLLNRGRVWNPQRRHCSMRHGFSATLPALSTIPEALLRLQKRSREDTFFFSYLFELFATEK